LSSTANGLDSLIGASTAQEVATGGDDLEQLKRYSEKIAIEADESEINARLEARQKRIKKKEDTQMLAEEDVTNAKIMAAKMND
jgi:hypothetical protein